MLHRTGESLSISMIMSSCPRTRDYSSLLFSFSTSSREWLDLLSAHVYLAEGAAVDFFAIRHRGLKRRELFAKPCIVLRHGRAGLHDCLTVFAFLCSASSLFRRYGHACYRKVGRTCVSVDGALQVLRGIVEVAVGLLCPLELQEREKYAGWRGVRTAGTSPCQQQIRKYPASPRNLDPTVWEGRKLKVPE